MSGPAYCLLPDGAALAVPTSCELFPTVGLSESSCYCYDKPPQAEAQEELSLSCPVLEARDLDPGESRLTPQEGSFLLFQPLWLSCLQLGGVNPTSASIFKRPHTSLSLKRMLVTAEGPAQGPRIIPTSQVPELHHNSRTYFTLLGNGPRPQGLSSFVTIFRGIQKEVYCAPKHFLHNKMC